jgi:hypothetical protein
MIRTLTAAAVLATLSTFTLSSAFAQASAPAAHAKTKAAARKPAKSAKAAEPVTATNDNLSAGQLAAADRVLTGVADCEMKEKVDVEKIPGHNGNFKVVYAHKSYTMVPEETTTGAVRLVDTSGALVWIQIPAKSMLMNQKEHHRLVDGCQEPEQRVTAQPPAATGGVAPGSTVTTTTTTTTTMKVVPPAPKNSSETPSTAASGMWK